MRGRVVQLKKICLSSPLQIFLVCLGDLGVNAAVKPSGGIEFEFYEGTEGGGIKLTEETCIKFAKGTRNTKLNCFGSDSGVMVCDATLSPETPWFKPSV